MTTLQKLNQYGTSFQTKVVGALLTQRKFLLNISESLDPEYFENTSHQWIIKEIIKYYNNYHTNPTIEYLNTEIKKIDNDILKISIVETLREAYKASDSSNLEWVEQEFTNFCKNQQVKNAIMTSVDLLNLGDYDGIRNLVNKALKSGEEKNIGLNYKIDIETRYRKDDRNPISFPWNILNNLTQGGLGKGDLALIFGSPGGGKSWIVSAIGAHVASLGYNVVHYTLELGEGYVGKRYDSIFSGIDIKDLHLHRDKVEEAVSKVKGKVIIKEYPPKRASFDTINSHLDQLKNHENIEAHLIIIDYLDYMKTIPKKDKKDEIDDIYIAAKSFSREKQIPLISPSQANRTASKSFIIEGENIAGSYDKLMIADLVISYARNKKDKIAGTARVHVMKNRYGPDGFTYSSKINTSNGYITIDEKPLLDDDEEESNVKQITNINNIDEESKNILRQKFFDNSLEN